MFTPWLDRWALTADGPSVHTHSSDLLPVLRAGEKAMLKIARSAEEKQGHRLMVWWAARGAARVLEHEGPALLIEHLDATPSLTGLVQRGQDDRATRILCEVAARLHTPRHLPWPELPPLSRWFRALEAAAPGGGLLARSWEIAQNLQHEPQEVCPLHGDIHHGNVLFSPARGWLAIDPKGLIGERTFDYANILCNPTLDLARRPGRLARQVAIVAEEARLDRARLLRWTVAYTGLSAAWHLEDGQASPAEEVLHVAGIALAELGEQPD